MITGITHLRRVKATPFKNYHGLRQLACLPHNAISGLGNSICYLSFAELYQKILKLMGSGEEYACVRQQGGKVFALDRNGRMVML